MTTENDPGRLPCPEAAATRHRERGIAAGTCTLPAIGRLPWRTLGLDKWPTSRRAALVRGVARMGEAERGHQPVSTRTRSATSRSTRPADVVALIIAPGRPLADQRVSRLYRARAAPHHACAGDRLSRFLECENASSPIDTAFVSTGPADSYNDQVLSITGAEMLPGIEAAVASRFERQFAPQLRTVYSGGDWPTNPALPFAATFANPSTSPFKGANATFGGLLPVTFSETAPGLRPGLRSGHCRRAQRPNLRLLDRRLDRRRVDPFRRRARRQRPTSTATTTGDALRADHFAARADLSFTLTGTAANVGMALRQLNSAAAMTNVDAAGRTVSGVLNNDGSATITLNGQASASAGVGFGGILGNTLCGLLAGLLCKQESISVPIALIADHPILDSTDTAFNWFFRNNWHQVSYYAVAPDIAPSGPRACGANCLTVKFPQPERGSAGLDRDRRS